MRIYTGDVGKRMGTYRVDEDLAAAVAAKAAKRGETVTDLIIQRFEAYIRDDEEPSIPSVSSVSDAPVYTPPERYEEPTAAPPCRHPAEAVEAGECRSCGADVW